MITVILNPFVMHHHHDHRICMTQDICAMDGNTDSRHTSHPEDNEEDGCPLQQKHNFIDHIKDVQYATYASIFQIPNLPAILTNTTNNFYHPDNNNFNSFDGTSVLVSRTGMAVCPRRAPPFTAA